MDFSEAKRLRALKEENAKLKRLLADQLLENAALKELLSKKWQHQRPARKLWQCWWPTICSVNDVHAGWLA